MKFKKKRKSRKLDYNERMTLATKEMLIDKKLGYDMPLSYYENKVMEDRRNVR